MTARPVRTINLARQAAKYLDSIGEAKRGEDVRALVRSNEAVRTINAQLMQDNIQLRAAIAGQNAGASR